MSVELVVATEEHKHVAGEPGAVQPLRARDIEGNLWSFGTEWSA